jgi:hypothetical protein
MYHLQFARTTAYDISIEGDNQCMSIADLNMLEDVEDAEVLDYLCV